MTPIDRDLDVLCRALDGVARALSSGRSDLVLAAEPPLASAVAALALRGLPQAVACPAHVRGRIREAAGAIARCEAMGAMSAGLLTTIFPGHVSYGRQGSLRCAPALRGVVESRT